ncbi:MAG: hypothetical protein ABSG02_10810 [Terriglobales bacterium]|jgi:hypothetical protein
MFKLKCWSSAVLLVATMAAPVLAENNNAKTSNDHTVNATSAEASPAADPNPSPAPSPNPSPSVSLTATDANVTALLGVLVMKGVLAPTEANAIQNASPTVQFQALVEALSRKGVLNVADLSAAAKPATSPSAVAAAPVAATEAASTSLADPEPGQAQTPRPGRVAGELPPPIPGVIPAIIPVRVFPIDPPKTGGLAGIKAGPITLAPYGFIKATVIHDSSDPDGDDFAFPALFLNAASSTNTGPTKDPEVHVKARSTRFGLNFEWPDMAKNLTVTGKIETDFEGNNTEVDNADISSFRNGQLRLRLAYVRLDWHASENTDIMFLGGQDWSLFGSGALPNILETTGLGFFYGDIYTRSPQLRVGFIQTLNKEHNVKFEGQGGVMQPSSGEILKLGSLGLAGQIGEGEREGSDSDRPEWEGRAALSFQLDDAKGVPPAQIALAGFHASRTDIALNEGAGSTYGNLCATTNYCTTFPNGFQASSKLWGGQLGVQLPTRWFTLVGSAYKGGDLRFYFGGQINSFATDTGGLTGIQGPFPTQDGGPLAASGPDLLGCSGTFTATGPAVGGVTPGSCAGNVVVAPQRALRAFGGFVQLGLPLSRWFNADPKGHNAGWQLFFDVGKDQAVHRDLNNPNFTGQLPLAMSKMGVATLFYRLNPWCQFGFEQSVYAGRINNGALGYTIAGVPSNEWQDHRTEAGPIFTF